MAPGVPTSWSQGNRDSKNEGNCNFWILSLLLTLLPPILLLQPRQHSRGEKMWELKTERHGNPDESLSGVSRVVTSHGCGGTAKMSPGGIAGNYQNTPWWKQANINGNPFSMTASLFLGATALLTSFPHSCLICAAGKYSLSCDASQCLLFPAGFWGELMDY